MRTWLSAVHLLTVVFICINVEAPQHGPDLKAVQNKSRDKSDSKGSSPVDPAPIMAASAELKPPGYSLRQSIAVRAKKLVQQQFSKSVAGRDTDTEGMKLLKDICKDLSRPTAITELLGVLKGTDGAEVSTFEFLSSGAVQQLRQYLLGQPIQIQEKLDPRYGQSSSAYHIFILCNDRHECHRSPHPSAAYVAFAHIADVGLCLLRLMTLSCLYLLHFGNRRVGSCGLSVQEVSYRC